jgi:subtilisin family serine protease
MMVSELRAASLPDVGQGPANRELIVLLGAGPGIPSPEEVVDSARQGRGLPGELGVGSPKAVRFLLPDRLTGTARQRLLSNPESPRARLERYIVLTYPESAPLDVIQSALRAHPWVLHVEPNLSLPLAVMPSDPLMKKQADPTTYQWGSELLKLPAAWDRITGHAYIGITDTGLEVQHPDLRAFHRVGTTWVYDGGNFRPQLSCEFVNGFPCNDSRNSVDEASPVNGATPTKFGHGTHVSGIIAATSDNHTGVAGACWGCSLMMAKTSQVLSDGTNASPTFAALAAGTSFLVDHGAQVINASLGGPAPACTPSTPGDLGAYCQSLAHMNSRDVVMFAASGNASQDINFPAKEPGVIAVGGLMPVVNGTQLSGEFWTESSCLVANDLCGSNYTKTPGSPKQILVTPAKQVLSTFYEGHDYFPPYCSNSSGYGLCTGTSMASPYAAGIGGLVRSANPLLTKANVQTLLINTASRGPNSWDPQMGYGIPNADAAAAGALGRTNGQTLRNRLTPLFSLFYSDPQTGYGDSY